MKPLVHWLGGVCSVIWAPKSNAEGLNWDKFFRLSEARSCKIYLLYGDNCLGLKVGRELLLCFEVD